MMNYDGLMEQPNNMTDIFDFIVVGAGSAGCAVAARLSESGRFSVLLIEAGGEAKNKWIKVPIGIGKLLQNKKILWDYRTEPDTSMKSQQHYWPRGKLLGGSSSVNGQVFVRGAPSEYESWSENDCPGWRYKDVLPFFKKLENSDIGRPEIRGKSGPIKVEFVRHEDELTRAFTLSCQEIGINLVNDYNDGDCIGVSKMQMSQKRGERCSTEIGYLKTARKRNNLHVLTGTYVSSLIIRGKEVVGVNTANKCDHGVQKKYSARFEVILCAGALNTPGVLERSGIGNSQLLKKLDIPVLKECPSVGENLQDHVNLRISYECAKKVTVNDLFNSKVFAARESLKYLIWRRGLFATPTVSVHAYLNTDQASNRPNFKFQLCHVTGADRFSMARGLGVDKFPGFSLQVFYLHPKSLGSVHIKSKDPFEAPKIVANYLLDDEDQAAAITGLKMIRNLASRPPLNRLIVREITPGNDLQSDADLLDFARDTGQTCWHSVATCKMGEKKNSVVDTKLRIHGLANVRIADASVLPHLVSSNTNAPSIMIGERCSEFLNKKYK